MRKLLLLALFFNLLFVRTSNGFHLVGGYISYEHLVGNDYKVNLHIFYDCFTAQQGDSLMLCIKSSSLNYDSMVVMYYDTSNNFPYHPCLGSPISCMQGGPTWGMSDNLFSCIISLPNAAFDWRFSATVCCRNFVPTTVSPFNNAIIPFYTYANLDNLNIPNNNSPQFNNILMPVFCIGVFTTYDFNCIDPDGDSLVYRIDSTFYGYPCSSDSTFSIDYNAPYNYLYFLDSSTPLSLNSSTGALSFTPSMIQTSIYSLKIDEYRNGVIIGSINRQEEILINPVINGQSMINDRGVKLSVFPNPVSTTLNVVLGDYNDIIITNVFGDIVMEKTTVDNTNRNIQLNIGFLSSGIYFLKSGNEVSKFVKK